MIGGDLNGHVGREGSAYRNVHGSYGFTKLNNEGKAVLDFAMSYELIIANMMFNKGDEHSIT